MGCLKIHLYLVVIGKSQAVRLLEDIQVSSHPGGGPAGKRTKRLIRWCSLGSYVREAFEEGNVAPCRVAQGFLEGRIEMWGQPRQARPPRRPASGRSTDRPSRSGKPGNSTVWVTLWPPVHQPGAHPRQALQLVPGLLLIVQRVEIACCYSPLSCWRRSPYSAWAKYSPCGGTLAPACARCRDARMPRDLRGIEAALAHLQQGAHQAAHHVAQEALARDVKLGQLAHPAHVEPPQLAHRLTLLLGGEGGEIVKADQQRGGPAHGVQIQRPAAVQRPACPQRAALRFVQHPVHVGPPSAGKAGVKARRGRVRWR